MNKQAEVPTQGMVMILDLLTKQPPFLTENWLRILACNNQERSDWKTLRVLNGILHVISPCNMVRLELPGCPDGFYKIFPCKVDKPIVEVGEAPVANYLGSFPDVERPIPRRSPAHFSQMNQQMLGLFEAWCKNQILSVGGTVVIDREMAFCRQNPNVVFQYPFNFPEPAYCHPANLTLALKEAQRYPGVYIDREPVSVNSDGERIERPTPIVLHYNGWNNCVITGTFLP